MLDKQCIHEEFWIYKCLNTQECQMDTRIIKEFQKYKVKITNV